MMLSEVCNLENRAVVVVYVVGEYAVIVNAARRDRGQVGRWCVVNWRENWVEGWFPNEAEALKVAEALMVEYATMGALV